MSGRDEQRDAYLRTQIDPGESILAAGRQGFVTDRRILFGWKLDFGSHAGEWTHDSLTFGEVVRWSRGRRHDDRPMLRIEHPTHWRLEWVPAHRFLWFRWGNETGEVAHRKTTFSFSSRRDPVFWELSERLQLTGAPQREPFVESLPGTREERMARGRRSGVYRVQAGPLGALQRLRCRISGLDEELHHGRIHWWIRVGSWALLAVPLAFVSPWLVLPAILAVEILWVVGLQWSWRRTRYPA
ncbi:MAG: hypothetical protein E6G40_11040 [Actinobacteria bacterium]|nr:MAG: hypothetical protein E6G44_08380 [Actinomycetota bacterium]TMK96587.1 MAG: hypothetical protein E6G40_11040 [Actinomycetota bacterium]